MGCARLELERAAANDIVGSSSSRVSACGICPVYATASNIPSPATKKHDRHISESLDVSVEPRSITLGACIHGGVANVQLGTRQEVWTARLN